MRGLVKHRFPILIGIIFLSVRFFPLLFGQSLLFGDNFSLMVPGKLYSASWLSKGIIPLWNPTQFAGLSWVGDINQSLFYPSTLLFVVFHPTTALNINLLLHVFLSFMGAYFLAREFSPKLSSYSWILAAVFWSFSPQFAGSLNNLATTQSLSYVPWVVLVFLHVGKNKKGSLFYAPAIVTLQLLGGYPQHVLFSVVFGIAASIFMYQAHYKKLLIVAMLSVMLSSWIWLPFIQTIRQSTRTVQTLEQAQTGALHIDDFVKIISPVFFDNPSVGYKWGPAWNRPTNLFLYFSWLGLIVLAMNIFKQKKDKTNLFLLVTTVICVLLAFGSSFPLYSIIQKIPIINSSRGASTILVLATLTGSLLVSRAIFQYKVTKSFGQLIRAVFILSTTAVFFWIMVTTYFSEFWKLIDSNLGGLLTSSAFHTIEKDYVLAYHILMTTIFQGVMLILSSLLFVRRRYILLVVLLAIDLTFFSKQYYFFGPKEVYEVPSSYELLSHVRDTLGNNFRILTRNYNVPYTDFGAYADALIVRKPFSDSFVDEEEMANFSIALNMKEILTPGWNSPVNISTINGYTTLLPELIDFEFNSSNNEPGINRLPEIPTTHNNLKKWAVGYYLVDTWFPKYNERFPENIVGEGDGWRLYELSETLTRIRYMDNSVAEVSEYQETPNELEFLVNAEIASELVIADRYDKDWRATVNGKSVEVKDTQGMRSIQLVQGTNEIRMWYSPTLFYLGLVISSITGASMLIWLFLTKK